MTTIAEAESSLRQIRAALNQRRAAATNDTEKQALADQVEQISDALDGLALAGLDAAAQAVAEATDKVVALVSSARLNPFSLALDDSLKGIANIAVEAAERLSSTFTADAPAAVDPAQPPPDIAAPEPQPAATVPAPPPAAVVPGQTPPLVVSSKFADLAEEYTLCWAACHINNQMRHFVEQSTSQLTTGEARYKAVSARTSGVPWQLIGIMHGLECGYNFFKHLHNGDSLSGKTTRVPAGRPPNWSPDQSWEDSAVDAVQLKKMHTVPHWSLPRVLYALEAFNGFGYRGRGIRSPYLWSFSNLYTKGKFIADHVYDENAVSKQVGSALVLKVLEERHLWP